MNTEKFLEMLKVADPDTYELKICLLETNVNPQVLANIIRSLAIIHNGTGYGEISIQIRDSKVGLIKSTETMTLDLPIV